MSDPSIAYTSANSTFAYLSLRDVGISQQQGRRLQSSTRRQLLQVRRALILDPDPDAAAGPGPDSDPDRESRNPGMLAMSRSQLTDVVGTHLCTTIVRLLL